MKKLKYYLREIIGFSLRPFVPINPKKIVFSSYCGQGYGCNPKYIAEELIREKVDCEMVWLIKDMNTPMPKEIRKVQFGSNRAKLELLSAGIWISNTRNFLGVRKRKKQFYIQTWHGPLAFKYVEKSASNLLSPYYIEGAQYDGRITDLFLSGSRLQSEEIRQDFWYDGEIMECGLPRNDILVQNAQNKPLIDEIKKKLNIASGTKIVLYAPTFRDNGSMDPFRLDFEKICDAAEKLYQTECRVLVRLHPNIAKNASFFSYGERVRNASDYPDMQELSLACDLLITDYSSTIFDAFMLGRDVVLYAPDLEEYQKTRGLRPIFFQLPYPMTQEKEELYHLIETYNDHVSPEEKQRFATLYGFFDTGHASEEVCKRIKERLGAVQESKR